MAKTNRAINIIPLIIGAPMHQTPGHFMKNVWINRLIRFIDETHYATHIATIRLNLPLEEVFAMKKLSS